MHFRHDISGLSRSVKKNHISTTHEELLDRFTAQATDHYTQSTSTYLFLPVNVRILDTVDYKRSQRIQ